MPVTIDLAPILALPVADRIAIAEAIWDSIPEDQLPPHELADEVKEMLDRRIEDHRRNPDDVIPAEQVYSDVFARLKRQS